MLVLRRGGGGGWGGGEGAVTVRRPGMHMNAPIADSAQPPCLPCVHQVQKFVPCMRPVLLLISWPLLPSPLRG